MNKPLSIRPKRVAVQFPRIWYAIKKASINKGDVGFKPQAFTQKSGSRTSPTISVAVFISFVNGIPLIQTKVKENSEWLVARVTVEQQNGRVLGIEALDVSHAVSGIFTSIKDGDITKTAESSASQGPHSGDYVERAHKLSADISIADLLKIINRTHQEFLSDDVIKRLGTERTKKKKGVFSKRIDYGENYKNSREFSVPRTALRRLCRTCTQTLC